MRRSRSYAVLAALGLIAVVPSSAAAAGPLAKPLVEKPTGTVLVSTPKGQRIAVAVPVVYRLRTAPGATRRARLTMTLKAKITLPSGKVLTAVTDRWAYQGESVRNVEHHAFLSPAQTKTFRAELARAGRKPAAAAGPAATAGRIAVSATVTVDTDGDRHVDATSAATSTAALPAPSTTPPGGLGELGHARGTDPCGYYGFGGNCVNQGGDTWNATHLWAVHSFEVSCEGAIYPYPATVGALGTPVALMNTRSNKYVPAVTIGSDSYSTLVTVSDDNVRGHPYAYQPVIPCWDIQPH